MQSVVPTHFPISAMALDDKHDLAAVKATVKSHAASLRALGICWTLVSTNREDAVVSAYDTLLFEKRIVHRANTSDVAPAIRDALCAWRTVSQRPGFSFQHNLVFWIETLELNSRIRVHTGAARVDRAFPRVVFFFGKFARLGRAELQHFSMAGAVAESLAPFLSPPKPTAFRVSHALLLSTAKESIGGNGEIECVVRFHFGSTAAMTQELFNQLVEQLPRTVASCRSSKLQLTGVELMGQKGKRHSGLEVNHMAALLDLSVRLPQELTLAIRFPYRVLPLPRSSSFAYVNARTFSTFVQGMTGFHGSGSTGRLEVLDLVAAFAAQSRVQELRFDFACLCTLLPFSTSLRELRVQIPSQGDLLWLAYAMFHPRSAASSWTTLAVSCITGRPPELDWQAVERLVCAPSRLMTLMEMLTNDGDEDIDVNQPVRHTLVTATVIKRTTVYALDRSARLVSLCPGDRVELCDTSVDLSSSSHTVETRSDDTTDVAVVVPGYGLGYIRKSSLVLAEQTTHTTARPTSCITSVCLGRYLNFDEQAFLRLLGPSLRHLRVSTQSWFEHQGFSKLTPNLETIDWCRFSAQTSVEDLRALPKLSMLTVVCKEADIDRCFQQLLTPDLVALRELRLQLGLSVASLAAVQTYMRPLFCRLRHCKISLVYNACGKYELFKWDDDDAVPLSGPCVGRLAFLSVVRDAQAEESGLGLEVLARLDSHLIGIVFSFYGRYHESFEVVEDHARFGAPRQLDELEDPESAWFGSWF